MTKLFLIVVLTNLLSCNNRELKETSTIKNKLEGSWKVIADQQLDSEDNVIKKDTSVSGLIIYNNDGKMSAQILWRNTRSGILNDTIMQQDGVSTGLGLGQNTWTFEQTKTLIDSYDSYFGDYTVDWKTNIVSHIVTANLRPEKEGTVYKRRFKINGDSLFLRNADAAFHWQLALVKSKTIINPGN